MNRTHDGSKLKNKALALIQSASKVVSAPEFDSRDSVNLAIDTAHLFILLEQARQQEIANLIAFQETARADKRWDTVKSLQARIKDELEVFSRD